jgi:aromatase
MGYIRNAVLIHAPIDDVFRLTNNVRTWPILFTEYESSDVLEETSDMVTFRLTTRPDTQGNQYSWIAKRQTSADRRSTYSERLPSSGPFERMIIRWWYDAINYADTIMTWEQEFTMKPQAPITEEGATNYLNTQTRLQQTVIKEKVEQMCGVSLQQEPLYRGVIVAHYQPGSEEKIADAFRRSDETELPHILGVHSRHVWVQDTVYLHFVEGQSSLPTILKEYAEHPLFQAVKAELDRYVTLINPDLPPMAKEIYRWYNPNR